MATWNGPEFYYKDWHSTFKGGEAHAFTWEYQTAADVLTITEIRVATNCAYTGDLMPSGPGIKESMGPEDGKALYRALRNWIDRYYGETELSEQDRLSEEGK